MSTDVIIVGLWLLAGLILFVLARVAWMLNFGCEPVRVGTVLLALLAVWVPPISLLFALVGFASWLRDKYDEWGEPNVFAKPLFYPCKKPHGPVEHHPQLIVCLAAMSNKTVVEEGRVALSARGGFIFPGRKIAYHLQCRKCGHPLDVIFDHDMKRGENQHGDFVLDGCSCPGCGNTYREIFSQEQI